MSDFNTDATRARNKHAILDQDGAPVCEERLDPPAESAEIAVACRYNRQFAVAVYWNPDIGLRRIDLVDFGCLINKDGSEGTVVRQLYTYKQTKVARLVDTLIRRSDPVKYCRELVTDWNCDDPNGPIALDATPAVGMALVPNQPLLERVA